MEPKLWFSSHWDLWLLHSMGLWWQQEGQSRYSKWIQREREQKLTGETTNGGLGRSRRQDTSPGFPLLLSSLLCPRVVGTYGQDSPCSTMPLSPKSSSVGQEKLLSNKVYVFESWTQGHCLIIVKSERSSSFFLGMKWITETSGQELCVLIYLCSFISLFGLLQQNTTNWWLQQQEFVVFQLQRQMFWNPGVGRGGCLLDILRGLCLLTCSSLLVAVSCAVVHRCTSTSLHPSPSAPRSPPPRVHWRDLVYRRGQIHRSQGLLFHR